MFSFRHSLEAVSFHGAAYLQCSMYCYVNAIKTAVEVNENETLNSNV